MPDPHGKMTSDVPPLKIRCRQIEAGDLASVTDLLLRGFPSRTRRYWSEGFQRHAGRRLPPDVPRYGFMLESDGRAVGVLLLLFTSFGAGDELRIRCNLSSWYVEPAFRVHALILVYSAMRLKGITYFNISAAPHTIPTIEAQGFRRYAAGVFVGIPSLKRGVPGTRIHRIDGPGADMVLSGLPERELLLDHAAMGCLSLVVEAPDGLHPFVFLPFRIRSGRLRPPVRQLIYARSISDYCRFAGPLGRYLLWRGSPLVLHDTDGPEPEIPGRFIRIGAKFFKGPDRPRLGDLAYTERVIFGP